MRPSPAHLPQQKVYTDSLEWKPGKRNKCLIYLPQSSRIKALLYNNFQWTRRTSLIQESAKMKELIEEVLHLKYCSSKHKAKLSTNASKEGIETVHFSTTQSEVEASGLCITHIKKN